MKKKEKRDQVLYVKVSKSSKDFLKKKSKDLGYSTLSEFVDELVKDLKAKK